jgi:hypothetical protein
MTTEKQIPPWGQDELSTLFQTAEYNDRVTSLKFPKVYSLLQRIDAAFRHVGEAVEKDSRHELLIPRLLIARTRSSFFASIRLSMSGQVPEACAVLRAGIEQAWYMLHIAKDPNPPERVTVWLRRNEDESSRSKCKNEFKIRNVHSTHLSFDPVTAKDLHELYERMIDLGGHPNPPGVLSSMNLSETEEETTCQVGLLAPKVIPVLLALKTAVEVAIGMFKVYQLIFPERFKIMSLDEEIEALVGELNRAFKAYVSQQ